MPYSTAKGDEMLAVRDGCMSGEDWDLIYDNWTDEPRKRCLLPFEAEPRVLGELRQAVAVQLDVWGVSHFTDVVELAVTELATNVVKHVGYGSPAALVLEVNPERLRIELHDTSTAMPRCGQASPTTETGRGLSILAGISDSWFALATPGGKAVCCEIAYAEAVKKPQPHEDHIRRGLSAMEVYLMQWGSQNTRPTRSTPAVQSAAADLVTDLMFWLADEGCDPDDILDRAQMHFEAEAEVAPVTGLDCATRPSSASSV